jgi:hypothetical protein
MELRTDKPPTTDLRPRFPEQWSRLPARAGRIWAAFAVFARSYGSRRSRCSRTRRSQLSRREPVPGRHRLDTSYGLEAGPPLDASISPGTLFMARIWAGATPPSRFKAARPGRARNPLLCGFAIPQAAMIRLPSLVKRGSRVRIPPSAWPGFAGALPDHAPHAPRLSALFPYSVRTRAARIASSALTRSPGARSWCSSKRCR